MQVDQDARYTAVCKGIDRSRKDKGVCSSEERSSWKEEEAN